MKRIINIPKLVITLIIAIAVCISLILAVSYMVDVFGNGIKKECELYFLNSEQTTLESEFREVRYKDSADLCIKVIDNLIKGPKTVGIKPILSNDVKFLTIDMNDNANIITNFSKEFLTGDSTKDILRVYAVVKTLCSISGIESVKVNVEGADIIAPGGEVIGALKATDIKLVSDVNEGELHEVTLYFTKQDTNMLYPEKRSIKITDQRPLAQHVVQELINGPKSKDLIPCLSNSSVLIGVTISDNKCYVDFKNGFTSKNSGSDQHKLLAVYSIVNSLTELDSVGRVQFLIDGKRIEKFGKIEMNNLFERNTGIIATY